MKKEGDIKRRYQHPDAVSYTPEIRTVWCCWSGRPFLLKIYGISTSLPCQKCTSLYTFDSEFQHRWNIASDRTSGIRAASEYPQRVRTAKDGGDSMQNLRVFHTYSFFSYCRYYESYGSIFAEKNRPTSLYRRVLYHRRICLWFRQSWKECSRSAGTDWMETGLSPCSFSQ